MSAPTRKLAAILAADVAVYSKLMGEDETGTLAALRELRNDVFQPIVSEHRGEVVKSMGDGLLLEFPSVVDATRCVIEISVRHGRTQLQTSALTTGISDHSVV